jgi:hypothetical protein
MKYTPYSKPFQTPSQIKIRLQTLLDQDITI